MLQIPCTKKNDGYNVIVRFANRTFVIQPQDYIKEVSSRLIISLAQARRSSLLSAIGKKIPSQNAMRMCSNIYCTVFTGTLPKHNLCQWTLTK